MNVVVLKKQNKNHFSDCIIENTGYENRSYLKKKKNKTKQKKSTVIAF